MTTETGGVDSQIQLYDSEIIKIEGILEILNKRRGQRISYEKYGNEVRERFAAIGLVVSVRWYSAGVEKDNGTMEKVDDLLIPEIVVKGRTSRSTFDHAQMGHEVQNDLLQLGTGGKLKVTAEDARKALQSARDHKHGKGCGH